MIGTYVMKKLTGSHNTKKLEEYIEPKKLKFLAETDFCYNKGKTV